MLRFNGNVCSAVDRTSSYEVDYSDILGFNLCSFEIQPWLYM